MSQVNGYGLEAGVEYEESLNAYTRYVRFQIPNVEESGLTTVGGFSGIEIWPAEDAQLPGAIGSLVTPEPEPTDVPADESVTEEPPAESDPEGDDPVEEPAPDGSDPEGPPDGTTEETPPPQT